MKSPFPGMDPYLEQFWGDVHARLVMYACDQLVDQLPANFVARVEERVVFEAEEEEHAAYPDVKIVETRRHRGAAIAAADIAVAEPVIVEYRGEPATETFINIFEGQRLVTVIEVLSLSNKVAGEGQRQYRQKQRELRDSKVSLVEIDLLRRGSRVLSLPASRIPQRIRTPYQICVRRGWSPRKFEIYAVPLRRPLPGIRIPLREKDDDIRLDLQSVLDQAYRKGRYYVTLDYRHPPDPPLTGDDARWAKTVIRQARKPA